MRSRVDLNFHACAVTIFAEVSYVDSITIVD